MVKDNFSVTKVAELRSSLSKITGTTSFANIKIEPRPLHNLSEVPARIRFGASFTESGLASVSAKVMYIDYGRCETELLEYKQLHKNGSITLDDYVAVLLTFMAVKYHDYVFVYDRFIGSALPTNDELQRLVGLPAQESYLNKMVNFTAQYGHLYHKDILDLAVFVSRKYQ